MAPPACELAFYGGTFTAIPEKERQLCLSFLDQMREEHLVDRARCSTRPDALSPLTLEELRHHGVELVELGIQSFCDDALARSRRGYTGQQALEGCGIVQDAGLQLGIQLLPGMPGCSPEIFLEDTAQALALRPACIRFYPCLVPEGTVLAHWWRSGAYQPWSLEETVHTLGRALAMAWEARIPVIRLSVAPEPSFDAAVLAGPRHPALGALIQAEALLVQTEKALEALGRSPERLELPRSCQGFLYGDKGALKSRWAELGLPPAKICFTDRTEAELF